MIRYSIALVGLLALNVNAEQTDSIRMEETVITGNKEQPKVLYIVPWQNPPGAGEINIPFSSMTDDLFQPMDREEFQRETQYHEQLNGALTKE